MINPNKEDDESDRCVAIEIRVLALSARAGKHSVTTESVVDSSEPTDRCEDRSRD